MNIQKNNYIFDVDIEATKIYSLNHSLCECSEDRNFYIQAKDKFPKLTEFLSDFGILIERPDETASVPLNNEIQYLFTAYTVIGKIVNSPKCEFDLFDGELSLHIVIDNEYIPNEQTTDEYFTINIYNICLPWVLDEPFPFDNPISLSSKIKKLLKRK